jgi:hypothetical protein
VDFYDISIIDGVNIPMEMRIDASKRVVRPDDHYFGGNPGGFVSDTGLGNCSWSFSPVIDGFYKKSNFDRLLKYVMVPGTVKKCAVPSDCPGTQICGATDSPTYGYAVCGTFAGYFSAVSACAGNSKKTAPFYCGTLTGQDATSTHAHLYSCGGDLYSKSGYQPDDGTTFKGCGCVNWVDNGIHAPASVCRRTNAYWTERALPWTKYLKLGCSTAYTFAYDDASSTFVYSDSAAGSENTASYVITYCPGESEKNLFKRDASYLMDHSEL